MRYLLHPCSRAFACGSIVSTISLQGHELVKGVGKGFPVIEGHSEAEVNITASANLLAGIRFIGDMMGRKKETLQYDFEAKLDMGGLFPSLRVHESGNSGLAGAQTSE